MKNHGFIRVASATIATRVANPSYNIESLIKDKLDQSSQNEVSLVVFPELCICGYSCGDLFGQKILLDKCEEGVRRIAEYSYEKNVAAIVGAPVPFNGRLYNCAIIIKDGEVKGIVPKTYLPNHGEYCESRWFASGSELIHGPEIYYAGYSCLISPNQIFEIGNATFAVEIGADILCPIPPSSYHALSGAQIIANLSAGNETVHSDQRTEARIAQHSENTICAYIKSSAYGDSSQDIVFTGKSSIWETGTKIAECNYSSNTHLAIADIDIEKIDNLRRKSTIFTNISPDGTPSSALDLLYSRIFLGECNNTDFNQRLFRHIERHPFAPENELNNRCSKIIELQTIALINRLQRTQCKAIIGISGGLDSTLALIITTLAFDEMAKDGDKKWARENIIGVTMPGFGTTSRTKNNAWDLMQGLRITSKEISIEAACRQHFKDIGHDPSIKDATYENTQARERTQILMDIANQTGGLVIGTGDLSELALGWATYNGDHMSMYGINADIPKTLVRSLVKWAAENKFKDMVTADGRSIKDILLDIVDTPISPELLPASENDEIQQVTEDLVGPYELHDFFLYNFARFGFSPEKILFLAQKAFVNYDEQTIKKWLNTFLRRFFSQQFKRSCMPDGPKVGSISLSPRGDWHMASDAWGDDFL